MNGSMGDAISHEPAPVPEDGLDVPPGVVWPTLPHLPGPEVGSGGLPGKNKMKETISAGEFLPEAAPLKLRG